MKFSNLKEKIKLSLKLRRDQASSLFLVFVASALLIPFQNCGGVAESGSGGGGSGQGGPAPTLPPGVTATPSPTPRPPTPTPTPSCPFNTNPLPVVSSVTFGGTAITSTTFKVGMGRDAGTEAPKTFIVNFTSSDVNSAVTAIDCEVSNNSGLNVNCDNINAPVKNGSVELEISQADDEECVSGNATVTITVDDAIVNANNAIIPACSGNNAAINLNRTSAARTFAVTVENACRPTQRVLAPNPSYNAQLGTSVAAAGNVAVGVAPRDNTGATNAGGLIIMRRNTGATDLANSWTRDPSALVPSNLMSGDEVDTVAISPNVNYIAAASFNANGGLGRVWLFQRNGSGQYVQVGASIDGSIAGSNFGQQVALSDSQLLISAPSESAVGTRSGAVYVYSLSNLTLNPVKLVPSGGDTAYGYFGRSIAVLGNTIAVGAPFNAAVPSPNVRREAVYIFESLVYNKKILSPAGNTTKWFGFALSLEGNNLLVGAPYHMNRLGAAYLYQKSTSYPDAPTRTYVQADPNNDGEAEYFGTSVALSGNRVLVSAPDKAEASPKFGAVYLYGTGATTQLFKIRSPAMYRSADSFGKSIAVSGVWLFSGAFNEDAPGGADNAGAIFIVNLP